MTNVQSTKPSDQSAPQSAIASDLPLVEFIELVKQILADYDQTDRGQAFGEVATSTSRNRILGVASANFRAQFLRLERAKKLLGIK